MLRGRRRGTGIRPLERERVLSAQDVEDLLDAAREHAPAYYALLLFLADTGCRIGEALALRWTDCRLEAALARIERSVDHLGRVGPTKTRRARAVELSGRLASSLAARRPDVFGADALVFPNEAGGHLDSANVRSRVFARLVHRLWGPARRVTPHDLRHTWVSRHLAAGTPIKWIQDRGGWTTAKILLDVYGHFLPTEIRGFADVVAGFQPAGNAPQAHPASLSPRHCLRAKSAKPLSSRRERWSRRPDSNRRPADYESAALPAELRRLEGVARRGRGCGRAAPRARARSVAGGPGGRHRRRQCGVRARPGGCGGRGTRAWQRLGRGCNFL